MLELICAIPESIGWAMVGAVAMVDCWMFHKLIIIIIQMIKERIEENRA